MFVVAQNVEVKVAIFMNIEITDVGCLIFSMFKIFRGSFILPKSLNWVECNDEVRAHPRSRVRRKVYEFLKKMPEALEFKILRRHDIWMEIFQDDCPDNEDIGLYFFPSGNRLVWHLIFCYQKILILDFKTRILLICRNDNYISLLECLSRQDLVMRSYINGVELLVFASALLREDFQSELSSSSKHISSLVFYTFILLFFQISR